MNYDGAQVTQNSLRAQMGRILIATAVSVEKEAVLRGLGGSDMFDVLTVGVGPVAAAARTAKALASAQYRLVISAGIGGGFIDRAEVGSLVIADEIVGADLGAESPDGFHSLDELGFGSARITIDHALATKLLQGMRTAGLPVTIGPILTLSTVTGTKGTALALAARVPGASAEAMEGFGVATAALDWGIPILEIRAISNLVGPRDKASWRIKEALNVLESASKIFTEVLL